MEHLEIQGLPFPASRVALGTWAIGGLMWGGTNDADAIDTIHRALDLGINIIDTAPAYGFGHAEEVVGKAIAGRRDNLLVATKVGIDWSGARPRRNSAPDHLREELEASLRRLQTDVIDLYQVHWPDESTGLEETAATLEDFRREGKIRAIGASNFSVEQLTCFSAAAPLAAVQPPYNMFERAAETTVLPFARQHHLTVLAYGSLCRGLLTGAITATTTFKGDDLRNRDPKLQRGRREQYLAAVAKLEALAKDRFGKSILALAVRWVLDRGHTIALWGARKPAQIAPVGDVMGWHIDQETMDEIDRILAETVPDPVGPEFFAPPRSNAA